MAMDPIETFPRKPDVVARAKNMVETINAGMANMRLGQNQAVPAVPSRVTEIPLTDPLPLPAQ
jgi:hypothetical protein